MLGFGTEASAIGVIFGIKSAVLPDQLVGGIVGIRKIAIFAEQVFQAVIVDGAGGVAASGACQARLS